MIKNNFKEISMTLHHEYRDQSDIKRESICKYVRRKRESDKKFRKRMRKLIRALNADIVSHEVIA
jgi:hypothetical protein